MTTLAPEWAFADSHVDERGPVAIVVYADHVMLVFDEAETSVDAYDDAVRYARASYGACIDDTHFHDDEEGLTCIGFDRVLA